MACCPISVRQFFHVNTPLVTLKTTVFLFYGAVFSLVPFLHLHVDYVGLSFPETATAYAILLIASFAGAPIAGFILDKVGRFKLIFSLVLAGVAISHNLLLAVPRANTYETPASANFLCTHTGIYLFTETCQLPDEHCPLQDGGDNAVFDIKTCQFNCRDPNDTGPFPHMQSLPSLAEDAISNLTSPNPSLVTELLSDDDKPQVCFQRQARRFSPQHCHTLRQVVMSPVGNITMNVATQMFSDKELCVFRVMSAFLGDELVFSPTCPANPPGCRLDCALGLRHANGSAFNCLRRPGDPVLTFYVYFGLRLVCMIFLGAAFSLLEAAILMKAKLHGGEYGKQRVWSIVAKAAFIPIGASLMEHAEASGHLSFFPAFLMFNILICLAFVLVVTLLRLEMTPQPKLRVRDMWDLFSRWEALLLYFAIFFLGAFWGFLDTFLPRYLLELGSSEFLLGVSRTVGGLVCIPTMFFADTIMNKVGRVNILIAAFLCYAVQMLSYSLIGNPWWSVAVEVLKFFTSCLKVASAVTLANSLAPRRLLATMQGSIHCLQYLIGSGIGHLSGGFIAEKYTARAALRVFGILSTLLGFMYGVSYYAIRKRQNRRAGEGMMMNGSKNDPQFDDLCQAESKI